MLGLGILLLKLEDSVGIRIILRVRLEMPRYETLGYEKVMVQNDCSSTVPFDKHKHTHSTYYHIRDR